jgi:hypothetical protein
LARIAGTKPGGKSLNVSAADGRAIGYPDKVETRIERSSLYLLSQTHRRDYTKSVRCFLAVYPVLAQSGTWAETKDPFATQQK